MAMAVERTVVMMTTEGTAPGGKGTNPKGDRLSLVNDIAKNARM